MSIQTVSSSSTAIQDWQEKTYKYLHSHPELSMQEKQTSQFIFETLQGYGYNT